MLVISRKDGESLKVGENVEVVVLSINGNRVKLGINAPREINVVRGEVEEKRPFIAHDRHNQLNEKFEELKELAVDRDNHDFVRSEISRLIEEYEISPQWNFGGGLIDYMNGV